MIIISVCQISESTEKQPEVSRRRSIPRHNSQSKDDLERIASSISDKVWLDSQENLDLPLLPTDKTNQSFDQDIGDSIEIPLQPTLKIRNKPGKADLHSRPRVKKDNSVVAPSPRCMFIYAVFCILSLSFSLLLYLYNGHVNFIYLVFRRL